MNPPLDLAPIFEFFGRLFTSELTVIAIIALLLAVALFAYFRCKLAIFDPLIRTVNAAERIVRESPIDNARKSLSESNRPKSKNSTVLAFWKLWDQFSRRCFHMDTKAQGPIWFTPEMPQNCFRASTIIRGTAMSFYRHLGGYLLAVGLLFTFLGIAIVTWRASGMVESVEDGKIRESLSHLLANASGKFWTSLAGLLSSVVYSILFRISAHKAEVAISEFADSLIGRVEDISQDSESEPHFIQYGYIRQDVGYVATLMLENQVTQRELIGVVAKKIGKAVDESLERRLESQQSIAADILERLKNVSRDALKEVSSEITAELREQLDQTLDHTRTSFSAIEEGFSNISQHYSTLSTDIEQGVDRMTAKFATASSTLGDSVEAFESGINECTRTMGETVSALSRGLHAIDTKKTQVADSLADAASKIQAAAQAVAGASGSTDELVQGVREAISLLQPVTVQLTSSASTLETAIESFRKLRDEQLRSASDEVSTIAQSATTMVDLATTLASKVPELGTRVVSLEDAIATTSSAVENLPLQPVIASMNELHQSFARLQIATNTMEAALRAKTEKRGKAGDRMQKAGEWIRRQLRTIKNFTKRDAPRK